MTESTVIPMTHRLAGDGLIPNNPYLPVLFYSQALSAQCGALASAFEQRFAEHAWSSSWRNGIFPFDHFHATAHEVLGIYSGTVTVRLGGDAGVTLELLPGDVLVIPAGVGHRQLASQGGLGVVGAYPDGQHPDLCRPEGSRYEHRRQQVAAVPMPEMDPVYGPTGPLVGHWMSRSGER